MSSPDRCDPDAAPWEIPGHAPIRAVFEYASMHVMETTSFPCGDGHPVVIFPGIGSERNQTGPLTEFCRKLGYTAYDWGRCVNTAPQKDLDAWIDETASHVRDLASLNGQQISLIGWGGGGIYARELAKKLQRCVRQVITLGTPFGGTPWQKSLAWIHQPSGAHRPEMSEEMRAQLSNAPDVPTTSIYSRSDGVVDWQTCLHDGKQVHAEDIEVDSSHFGLGWNPEVLSIIADRLGKRRKSAPTAAWSRRRTERATALLLAMAPASKQLAQVRPDEPPWPGTRHRLAQ